MPGSTPSDAPSDGPSRPVPSTTRNAALRTVQPRAAATRDALLSAGRALLADRDFDALSIAELAGAIGLSVGSFYGRFRDKEAFFALLQLHVTEEWRGIADDVLQRLRRDGDAPARIVSRVAATYLQLMRRDAGVVRACLKHASTHPGSWTPIHAVGLEVSEQVADLLVPRLGHLTAAQRAPRVRFAMQMLFGTGLNAVLNDPGPLRLADRRLERELARAMAAYLGLAPPGRLVR